MSAARISANNEQTARISANNEGTDVKQCGFKDL
jgi:hypothetical protein